MIPRLCPRCNRSCRDLWRYCPACGRALRDTARVVQRYEVSRDLAMTIFLEEYERQKGLGPVDPPDPVDA